MTNKHINIEISALSSILWSQKKQEQTKIEGTKDIKSEQFNMQITA
jgi:hypothetical protein